MVVCEFISRLIKERLTYARGGQNKTEVVILERQLWLFVLHFFEKNFCIERCSSPFLDTERHEETWLSKCFSIDAFSRDRPASCSNCTFTIAALKPFVLHNRRSGQGPSTQFTHFRMTSSKRPLTWPKVSKSCYRAFVTDTKVESWVKRRSTLSIILSFRYSASFPVAPDGWWSLWSWNPRSIGKVELQRVSLHMCPSNWVNMRSLEARIWFENSCLSRLQDQVIAMALTASKKWRDHQLKGFIGWGAVGSYSHNVIKSLFRSPKDVFDVEIMLVWNLRVFAAAWSVAE